MPYTVVFLDQKLYQSISFDADINFPDISEYAKKIWVLKEYKKTGAELDLVGTNHREKFLKTHSSYSIQKSFQGDELVVELIENIKFSDNFNYFSIAQEIEKTGEKELDHILSAIKKSEYPPSVIISLMFGSEKNIGDDFDVQLSDNQKRTIKELFGIPDNFQFADFKKSSDVDIEEDCDCPPDCDCDPKCCDNE